MPPAADLAPALLNGLTWGISVALVAPALNLILGLPEIVNVAHGSLYMLGAVSAWFVAVATGSFLLALVLAALGALRDDPKPIERHLGVGFRG